MSIALPTPGSLPDTGRAAARELGAGLPVSAVASVAASFLSAFTVSLVGEMPVGEFVLIAVAGWAAVCTAMKRRPPGPLFGRPGFPVLMAAQGVAFAAYVLSDLYRHSSALDAARGWSRMVLLAIDVVAVAYLFGRSRRNLTWFVLGLCAGECASAWIVGPLFGDMWKFGLAAPVTFATLLAVPWAGALATAAAALALGAAHFVLDYRSFGGLCIATGLITLLQLAPRTLRRWLLPLAGVAAAAAVLWLYGQTDLNGQRSTRSDVERSAMIQAAWEAFRDSPLIGQGSWFSHSRVNANFAEIREESAKADHLGGFPQANQDTESVAVHSQILVALAEGGLFGGAFFMVYGAGLVRALWRIVFTPRWHRSVPLLVMLLLLALWNLLFSPFSGEHRVQIALSCGIILLL